VLTHICVLSSEGPELVSADMQREQERLRWEAEAQAQVEGKR
jgi:hypothetical protein